MHPQLRDLLRQTGLYEPLWCWKRRRADRSPDSGIRAWIRYFEPFLSSGGLCFDIGAHIGQQTLVFVSLGERVIAVEPRAEAARQLRCRFRERDVEVCEMAVSDTAGSARLHVNSSHDELSSLVDGWSKQVEELTGIPTGETREITVQTTTLDELIARYGLPQLCKIDVEGLEQIVLRGLHAAVPHLLVEVLIADEDHLRECVALVEANGTYEYRLADPFTEPAPWLPAEDFVAMILSLPSGERTIADFHARLVAR